MTDSLPTSDPAAAAIAMRNVGLFMAFRILFNIRFYYPVFMVMFLRYGITLEQFGLLNAIWAVVIVLLEVPSGALADLLGRRALLVAAAVMMALEMLLLAVVALGTAWARRQPNEARRSRPENPHLHGTSSPGGEA